MTQSFPSLHLTVLDADQHSRTCGYWYLVTFGAFSHTAFSTKGGLEKWMTERGLSLSQPLTEPGTWSTQRLEGGYNTEMHYTPAELVDFNTMVPLLTTRTLSNGDYVLAKITEKNGVRTVHTLNPNIKTRLKFDYTESRILMDS